MNDFDAGRRATGEWVEGPAHIYRLGNAEVVLMVPDGIRAPRALSFKRTPDAVHAVFEHVSTATHWYEASLQ